MCFGTTDLVAGALGRITLKNRGGKRRREPYIPGWGTTKKWPKNFQYNPGTLLPAVSKNGRLVDEEGEEIYHEYVLDVKHTVISMDKAEDVKAEDRVFFLSDLDSETKRYTIMLFTAPALEWWFNTVALNTRDTFSTNGTRDGIEFETQTGKKELVHEELPQVSMNPEEAWRTFSRLRHKPIINRYFRNLLQIGYSRVRGNGLRYLDYLSVLEEGTDEKYLRSVLSPGLQHYLFWVLYQDRSPVAQDLTGLFLRKHGLRPPAQLKAEIEKWIGIE